MKQLPPGPVIVHLEAQDFTYGSACRDPGTEIIVAVDHVEEVTCWKCLNVRAERLKKELAAIYDRQGSLTVSDPKPIKRTIWTCTVLNSGDGLDHRFPTDDYEKAILVSSLLVPTTEGFNPMGTPPAGREWHAPALDFDFPCRLIPSSTGGHFHLYIDKYLSWDAYEKVLVAMRDAGLLEWGFVENSIARRQTMLLKPGLTKQGAREMGVSIRTTSADVAEQDAFEAAKAAEREQREPRSLEW